MMSLIAFIGFVCPTGEVVVTDSPIATYQIVTQGCSSNWFAHCEAYTAANDRWELFDCAEERVFASGFDETTQPSGAARR